MKKSVCAAYFPGVISLMKMLPSMEFDLILTNVSGEIIDESAVSVIEGEGILWIERDKLGETSPDFFISETDNSYGDPILFKDKMAEIRFGERVVELNRKTKETDISVKLDLDGNGETVVDTGIGFFDHMLEQIAQHGGISLEIKAVGDLQVDEHHTIEDTGILLGEAFNKSLGSKLGIARYGFALPMDESRAEVLIDFGGRSDLVWNVSFSREKIGDMPTEMFRHFFKSFSSSAKCTLQISASGENEHHKIEGIFKAFARAIKAAVKREVSEYRLPSSKGVI